MWNYQNNKKQSSLLFPIQVEYDKIGNGMCGVSACINIGANEFIYLHSFWDA